MTLASRPDSATLRRALADRLAAGGDLRSPDWRAALQSVSREVFLGDRIYRRLDTPDATLWEPLTVQQVGRPRWLELAYQDITWVTQFDAADTFPDGTIQGAPTSSSTLPSLVVRMLEDLEVADGHAVLEIGTGSGYSCALMCQRLGAERVTSVEVDPGVAERSRVALAAAGYSPTLVNADGLAGYPDRAPYDRIIATCSVRSIPASWLSQTVPGGKILAPLSGWLYGSGLAAIDVAGDGAAEGRFLPGYVSFMPARAHAAPTPPTQVPAVDGEARTVVYGPGILDDWMGRFLAQLAVPTAQRIQLAGDHDAPPTELLIDRAVGAHARLTTADDGTWTVQQHGPVRLWDRVERTYRLWCDAGQPPQHKFTVHITPAAQEVRLETADGTESWPLPAP